MSEPVELRHNKVRLALWPLAEGEGTPLLLLNGLAERSPVAVPTEASAWTGPVFALDVTGHGASSHSVGGGYTAEQLLGDVDAALAHLGPAAIWGRGLGGYLATLAAGARSDIVRGAVVGDGPGLAGGGPSQTSAAWVSPVGSRSDGVDPYAALELSQDPRPPDYVMTFARIALLNSEQPHPLVVAARHRPPWLAAVADEPGVAVVDSVAEGLGLLG